MKKLKVLFIIMVFILASLCIVNAEPELPEETVAPTPVITPKPTPTPTQVVTPTPTQVVTPTPTPESVTPTPENDTPTPTPESVTPTPESVTPTPENETPTPTPEGVTPTPENETPTPTPEGETVTPTPTAKATKKPTSKPKRTATPKPSTVMPTDEPYDREWQTHAPPTMPPDGTARPNATPEAEETPSADIIGSVNDNNSTPPPYESKQVKPINWLLIICLSLVLLLIIDIYLIMWRNHAGYGEEVEEKEKEETKEETKEAEAKEVAVGKKPKGNVIKRKIHDNLFEYPVETPRKPMKKAQKPIEKDKK